MLLVSLLRVQAVVEQLMPERQEAPFALLLLVLVPDRCGAASLVVSALETPQSRLSAFGM